MRNTALLSFAFTALLSSGALAADFFNGFAVVNADGSAARAAKGVTPFRITTGDYTVLFPADVKTCAYSVTAGTGDTSVPAPAIATAVMKAIAFGPARGQVQHNAVEITTYDHSGTPVDSGFHLVVQCTDHVPDAAAVVDPDGTLSRGFNTASALRLDTGSYVVTPSNGGQPATCAYTATVGLSAQSGVSDPGFVTVAQGPDGTIAVRTYDKTGNAADLGFHTIVSCPIF